MKYILEIPDEQVEGFEKSAASYEARVLKKSPDLAYEAYTMKSAGELAKEVLQEKMDNPDPNSWEYEVPKYPDVEKAFFPEEIETAAMENMKAHLYYRPNLTDLMRKAVEDTMEDLQRQSEIRLDFRMHENLTPEEIEKANGYAAEHIYADSHREDTQAIIDALRNLQAVPKLLSETMPHAMRKNYRETLELLKNTADQIEYHWQRIPKSFFLDAPKAASKEVSRWTGQELMGYPLSQYEEWKDPVPKERLAIFADSVKEFSDNLKDLGETMENRLYLQENDPPIQKEDCLQAFLTYQDMAAPVAWNEQAIEKGRTPVFPDRLEPEEMHPDFREAYEKGTHTLSVLRGREETDGPASPAVEALKVYYMMGPASYRYTEMDAAAASVLKGKESLQEFLKLTRTFQPARKNEASILKQWKKARSNRSSASR